MNIYIYSHNNNSISSCCYAFSFALVRASQHSTLLFRCRSLLLLLCVCVWCRNVELLFKFSILSNKAGLYMRSWSIFAHSQKNACKRITTRNAKSLLCAVPSGANPGKTLRSPASLNTFLLSLFLLWLFDVIADGGHGTPHC